MSRDAALNGAVPLARVFTRVVRSDADTRPTPHQENDHDPCTYPLAARRRPVDRVAVLRLARDGRQPAEQKETNMQRFVSGDTQIMVATTVIEVGVNVPNASVMVIESSEKFGLSQLHQLRGRVGRGSEKSFCVLLTGQKVSNDARERIKIMCATNDGFLIAEKDLELRGPGDIEGTRQSGALNFKLANIVNDKEVLEVAKTAAEKLVEEDHTLTLAKNLELKNYLESQKSRSGWGKIS